VTHLGTLLLGSR